MAHKWKSVCVHAWTSKKSHERARAWDFCLPSMYEVILLMSYCWRFIVSKNRLQCNSTKIPHGYWRQANLFVSITIRTDLPGILLPMRLRNDLSFSKIAIFHFVKKNGKISAQPYPTKCIQFLDRENNEKNNTLPLGKQICFSIVWGCAKFYHQPRRPLVSVVAFWMQTYAWMLISQL